MIAVALLLAVSAVLLGGGKLLKPAELKRKLTPLAEAAGKAIQSATESMKATGDETAEAKEAEEEAAETPPAAAAFDAIDHEIDALKQKQAAGGIAGPDAKKKLHELERRYREASEAWSRESVELIAEQGRMGILESEGQAIDPDVKTDIQRQLDDGRKAKLRAKEKLLRRGARLTP
ncbi:hypothetical protein [Paludisphaera borealis]|uniref:hypothetical protein n=1 Tax=Paludisphaera borealis TaxID=1387353 RepID=UPI0011AB3075|nr:hypothetical protein [Paludisphaera borealis]